MTIILSSTIIERSQHSVAVAVYHVCDCVTRTVWFVMLRMKQRAVHVWSCSRDIFVQLKRITDMKLASPSNMKIILSSSIFEPSQYSVAVTVYHVVMYDCVTRMVRFVVLRMK